MLQFFLLIGKSKKTKKMNRKRQLVSDCTSSDNLLETRDENAEEEFYQMSSGDEDYSKGMKSMILVSQKSYFVLMCEVFLGKILVVQLKS